MFAPYGRCRITLPAIVKNITRKSKYRRLPENSDHSAAREHSILGRCIEADVFGYVENASSKTPEYVYRA